MVTVCAGRSTGGSTGETHYQRQMENSADKARSLFWFSSIISLILSISSPPTSSLSWAGPARPASIIRSPTKEKLGPRGIAVSGGQNILHASPYCRIIGTKEQRDFSQPPTSRLLSTTSRSNNIVDNDDIDVDEDGDGETTSTSAAPGGRIGAIRWCQSCVRLGRVYQSYPHSLWRTLTSSVPRRKFALENVTVSFVGSSPPSSSTSSHQSRVGHHCHGVVLLLGASSSGKSTILKLILGDLKPSTGSADVGYDNQCEAGDEKFRMTATPVLLDERTAISSPDSVEKRLTEAIQRYVSGGVGDDDDMDDDWGYWTTVLLRELSSVCSLSPEQPLASLSPSEYYRFRVAQACIESSLHHCRHSDQMKLLGSSALTMVCDTNNCNATTKWLPGPILLLDEWMDVETSTVVRNVQPCLHNVVHDLGGVVICVTHKPYLFNEKMTLTARTTSSSPSSSRLPPSPSGEAAIGRTRSSSFTKVTLCAGKVLSVEYSADGSYDEKQVDAMMHW